MKRAYVKPWIFGIASGAMVVLAEAFAKLYPPAAYSFCLTCHTRDLVNTVVNGLFDVHFQTTILSRRVLMLTSPSVLIGAFIAARSYTEQRRQKSTRPLLFFTYGMVVMILGILIFGCPTRIVIRTGYGDLFGMIALAGMVLGIWLATLLIRRRWSRSV
jgi:hypothetical protein